MLARRSPSALPFDVHLPHQNISYTKAGPALSGSSLCCLVLATGRINQLMNEWKDDLTFAPQARLPEGFASASDAHPAALLVAGIRVLAGGIGQVVTASSQAAEELGL